MIAQKVPFWERAILAFKEGDTDTIEAKGENDLACRELQLLLMEQKLAQADQEG